MYFPTFLHCCSDNGDVHLLVCISFISLHLVFVFIYIEIYSDVQFLLIFANAWNCVFVNTIMNQNSFVIPKIVLNCSLF